MTDMNKTDYCVFSEKQLTVMSWWHPVSPYSTYDGIICDGAKASCGAKISSALDASLFAHSLAMRGKVYESNTGIIRDDTGETISWVGHIGKVGMMPTDKEIVKLMVNNS